MMRIRMRDCVVRRGRRGRMLVLVLMLLATRRLIFRASIGVI